MMTCREQPEAEMLVSGERKR